MTKKQAAAAKAKRTRAGWRKVKNIWPVVDEDYKDWIRRLPCVVCWGFPGGYQPAGSCHVYWKYENENGNVSQRSSTECAHVGSRGLRQKCSDRETIPLCGFEHHREGKESAHKLGKLFWEHHGIDRDVLIAALNEAYEAVSH